MRDNKLNLGDSDPVLLSFAQLVYNSYSSWLLLPKLLTLLALSIEIYIIILSLLVKGLFLI